MPLIAPEFALVFDLRSRRKRNITENIRYQSIREKARRVCGNSPEVMVRITSYGKGEGNARANLGYISRIDLKNEENVPLETDRGVILAEPSDITEYAKGWEDDFVGGKKNKNRRDTMRMILSMPEGTSAEAVKNATREFARQTFSNHEYVFALHTDEPHPHCHLAVKTLGRNGKRLYPSPDDLADWREVFAHELRVQGVDAEATRRAARGVVRKAEKSPIRQMKAAGREPRVAVLQELDAIAILKAEHLGRPTAPRPWEAAIRAEQQAVRGAWLALADKLSHPPPKPVFNQESPHGRPNATQYRAAVYQSDLAAPRPGEPPRAVASLLDVPGIDVVRHGSPQVLLLADARHRVGRGAGAGHGLRWTGAGVDGDRPGQGREGATSGRSQGSLEGGGERNSTGQGRGKSGAVGSADLLGTIDTLPRMGAVSLSDVKTTHASDQALACDIRAFVAAMPAVETVRDVLKRQLKARFSVPAHTVAQAAPAAQLAQAAQVAQTMAQKNSADHAAPNGDDLAP